MTSYDSDVKRATHNLGDKDFDFAAALKNEKEWNAEEEKNKNPLRRLGFVTGNVYVVVSGKTEIDGLINPRSIIISSRK